MKRSKYGSIENNRDNNIIENNTNANDIISQTYCRCSFIIEPVIFLLNIAISIQSIAFGQFIYIRILNRLMENDSSSITPSNITNSSTLFYSFHNFTTLPTTTTLLTTTPSSTNNDRLCISNSSSVNNRSLFSTDSPTSDPDQIRNEAQKQTAHFLFILSLFGGIPSIFTTNLLGVNSTKLGRKLLLVMSIFVMTIRSFVFLLISINPKLPDYLFYLCALIDGLSGSNNLFYLISHCYVADLTTEKNRSYRITLVNYIGLASSLLVSFGCGYVIKYLGYVYIFSSALFFDILAFIYLIIFVPEPLSEVRKKCILDRIKSCSLVRIKNSFHVLFHKTHPVIKDGKVLPAHSDDETNELLDDETNRPVELNTERQQAVIILVVIANLIYCAGGGGLSSIFTLYIMNKPFCWDSVNISTFTLYSTVVAISCSLFVSKFIKINDIIICIFSVLSHIFAVLCYAFATNSFGLYIGVSVASISGLEYGYVRSLVSKLITKDEITDAITLIACVDTFTGFLGQTLFPLIYEKIVDTHIRIAFYSIVGIVSVTLILHIIALILYKRPPIAAMVETSEEIIDDSSIGIASIEAMDPLLLPTCSTSNQAESISQLYNSLVIASHENNNDNKSTA